MSNKGDRKLVPECSDHELAEIALGFINEKESVKFQLDQPLGSGRLVLSLPILEWCHVSFLARRRSASSNADDDSNDDIDISPKIIFAELQNAEEAKFILHAYSIMVPKSSEIKDGCLFCPADGNHPHPVADVYCMGSPYGLRGGAPKPPGFIMGDFQTMIGRRCV